MVGADRQGRGERAVAVGQGEDQRDAVVVRLGGQAAADRDEPGLVVFVVVDAPREDGQAVERGRLLGAHGRKRQVARLRDRLGRDRGVFGLPLGKAVGLEEVLALAQRGLDRAGRAHRRERGARQGAQAVLDAVHMGVRDVQVVLHEQVAGLVNRADGRVLGRHDARVRLPRADRAEHVLEGGDVEDFLGVREHGARGLRLIGGGQALVGHAGGLVLPRGQGQRQALGLAGQHELVLVLARDAHDRLEQRGVLLPQPGRRLRAQRLDEVLLAVGLQDGVARGELVGRHLLGAGHAAQEQRLDLAVDGRDLGARLVQRTDVTLLHSHSPPGTGR